MGEIKLKRYHEYKERESDISMFEEPDGEWVKWEDVKILLASMPGTLDRVLTGLQDMGEYTDEIII